MGCCLVKSIRGHIRYVTEAVARNRSPHMARNRAANAGPFEPFEALVTDRKFENRFDFCGDEKITCHRERSGAEERDDDGSE